MLSLDYAPKRTLLKLMKEAMSFIPDDCLSEMKTLLDGMDEMRDNSSSSVKTGNNDLSLVDWADVFVIAMNEEMDPDKVLYDKVENILTFSNQASELNISEEEIERALEALKRGQHETHKGRRTTVQRG